MAFRRLVLAVALGLALAECGSRDRGGLRGDVRVDGSSTVFPITEAIAEEFRIDHPDVRVTIGVSGTGGGFSKFIRGEIDINNSSRPVKEKEALACRNNQIGFIELKVAYDGLVVVVNKDNTWLNEISVEELKKIWEPEAQERITRWSQVNPSWPDEPFRLYGPGVASGTYDYFTEAIVGESASSRGDYTASEDDNVLVQGISGDKNGLGFFGLAYYEENKEKLKLVGVSSDGTVVLPSAETVRDGSYKPLSRPVFIYVSEVALQREEVEAFARFYLENAALIVPDVGYVPLTDAAYRDGLEKLNSIISAAE